MRDLIFVLAIIGFFGLALGYLRFAEALGGRESNK